MGELLKALQAELSAGAWIDQHKEIFITKRNNLLIGPHGYLSTFAKDLRGDYEAQQVLQKKYGLDDTLVFGRRTKERKDQERQNDKSFPVGEIMTDGFRHKIAGQEPSNEVLKKVKELQNERRLIYGGQSVNDKVKDTHRLADIYSVVGEYFESITLQAHHIIEDSLLKKLGKNINDLAYSQAPCVLIKGELHQRFFSAEGTTFRTNWKHKEEELRSFYDKQYNSTEFSDLKKIAEIIIKKAFHPAG